MPALQPISISARRAAIVSIIVLLAVCSSLLVTAIAHSVAAPSVSINQGTEQPDPTDTSPIIFEVQFSEPVTGFETGDVALSGTAGATTATVVDSGDSTFFTILVTGMTTNGTVIANVPAGVALNEMSEPNQASSSMDNTVTFTGFVTNLTFVVTKTADSNDGTCNADCSLREAITAANANSGVDTIAFNIPVGDPGRNVTTGVCTITVNSILGALPQITSPVTIDGYTQGTISTPADPSDDATPNTHTLAAGLNTHLLIELTDDVLGVTGNGLSFGAGSLNSRVRGLSIFGFTTGAGVNLANAEGVRVEGNFLGVRADGSTTDPNNYGVSATSSPRTSVGGSTPATSNLISGNNQGGVFITGLATVDETPNSVLNNLIGTNSIGLLGLPNAEGAVGVNKGGVIIVDARGVKVGAVGAGNVISGNNGIGVLIARNSSETNSNIVQANLIGTTADGSGSLPNSGDGIEISNSQSNLVGGAGPGEGNSIRNNTANGIALVSLMVTTDSEDNTITGNTITGNGMDGVLVMSGTGNRINSNSIFSNTQQGIDLLGDGVTANDANDTDPASGPNPNRLQNYPVITSATGNTTSTTITGTIDGSDPDVTYRVEFFSNPACDGTNGEGQTFIGSVTTDPADSNGNASFTFQATAGLIGQAITTTATSEITNDTSEFSVCSGVTGDNSPPSVTINQAAGQPDPTTTSPINFTVVFSETVNGFQTGDVTLSGTAGATTATVTGSGTTYNVAVSGMTQAGTVVATIAAGVAADLAGNPNTASTSTDNTVLFNIPTLQFAQASYTVSEDCTFVTITVTRAGDTANPVTIHYATSPLQASERSDYTTAVGTLRFAAGATSASFNLLISEDSYAEATEMLSINLTNPTGGAQLGAASTAIVSITDDGDTGTGPNAIDDPATFVGQHYHDFLGRQADSAGMTFWTNELTSCGSNQACIIEKRTNVSAAFFLSVEFQKTGYFVMRTYKTAFGNQPDIPRYDTFIEDMGEVNRGVVVGQGNWQAQLDANQQAYTLALVSRSDFVASYPQGSPAAQYVDALFQRAGVTPTAAERGAAISAYGSGDAGGRAAALRSIVESDSIYNAFYNPSFVLMEYYGYLRRNPNDPPDDASFGGYNFWLAKMNQFTQPGENARDEQVALQRVRRAQMVTAFINSSEYRQRFGQ